MNYIKIDEEYLINLREIESIVCASRCDGVDHAYGVVFTFRPGRWITVPRKDIEEERRLFKEVEDKVRYVESFIKG